VAAAVTTLWDTNGGEVVTALGAERRNAGAVAFGLVLTLVVVVDERHAGEAIAAAAEGAAAHPCRLLVVIRRQLDAVEPRLDAEVSVGGRLGTGESVVLRMHGPLGRHAESVVLPLLAPDTPVISWWFGPPPERIADDCLGALADRRITDMAAAPEPGVALAQRAADYSPGDTDLAWTRLTLWRSLLAAAFDSVHGSPVGGSVQAEGNSPSAQLLGGWLSTRLGVAVPVETSQGPGLTGVALDFDAEDGRGAIRLDRPDGRTARLSRTGQPDRVLPLPRRRLGDLIGEELRRLDPDEPYADALFAATGRAIPQPAQPAAGAEGRPTAIERQGASAGGRRLGSGASV